MRTTVDLPPAVHARTLELARARGISLSALLSELTVRGLAQIDEPVRLATDERTGLPMLSLGRRLTSEDVAELIDEVA
ncbi:hypothetical protein [Microbacterium sp. YJN-G]|uniref:hypothetical protein n=1 Tax=Microbacterium sp. YJN-G TaxID=2763257 RepID=UPI0018784707|nr:hypothetical protein [Microbacterium sp. YJN-G]